MDLNEYDDIVGESSTDPSHRRLRVDDIDNRCDEFEDALRAGRKPTIEDYLESATPDIRRELFLELLLSEQEIFRDSGHLVQHSDYSERFPEYQQEIQQVFTNAASAPQGQTFAATNTKLAQIGPYQIIGPLGEGGMGTVYKAEDSVRERTVAIKVLPKLLAQNDRTVARFRREMKTIVRLDHPNVVQAYHADSEDDQHYIVMEYLNGLDLGQIGRTLGYLEVSDACEIVRRAALGVSHLHQSGVVHRDIKPSNIMLSADLSAPNRKDAAVKIIDFGLVWIEELSGEELTTSRDVFGTVQYMAPEQFSSSQTVSETADIYSLGATLYRLLCGKSPYQSVSQTSLARPMPATFISKPLPITQYRSDIPARLATFLSSMLARDPKRRIQTAAEVVNTLEQFATKPDLAAVIAEARQHHGVPRPLRTPLIPHRKTSRRYRNWIAAILLLPLMVLIPLSSKLSDVKQRSPALTATTADSKLHRTIQISQHVGLSSFEAIHWKDRLYLFYSDEHLFGIEAAVDNQMQLVSVRQSHFVGHRSFCGRDPKRNPPLFPVIQQASRNQQELFVFLPTGSADYRMTLTSLHYYKVADQGAPELKQPWEAANVFDYYLSGASGAPPMKPLCGSASAFDFPADVNSCCIVGDNDGVLIICTRVAPELVIYRVPWSDLDSAGSLQRSAISIPGESRVRHSDAVTYNDRTTGETRLQWLGSTEATTEGNCQTLAMDVSTKQFNSGHQFIPDSVQWNQFNDLPPGEIKLLAPAEQNVQAMIMNRGGLSPTIHTFERNSNGLWKQIATREVPPETPHFATVCTNFNGGKHATLLVSSPEQTGYHSIEVIPQSVDLNADTTAKTKSHKKQN